MEGSEKVSGCFVVACCDGTEELEPGEEVFDQVAAFVVFPVVLSLHFSIGPRRDDRLFSGLLEGGSPGRELRPPGSVRAVRSNAHPCRNTTDATGARLTAVRRALPE